jgi:pyruvate, orthophosphate dikinase
VTPRPAGSGSASPTLVYRFEDADATQPGLFGGKGAGLARMTAAGLPVPPGFIITTEACRAFMARGAMPKGLIEDVHRQLADLEDKTGRRFGRGPTPLLVSVRSGAPISMPGMMDTLLNLGLNQETAIALAVATGDVAFMADVYSRFCRMFADIVLGDGGDAVTETTSPIRAAITPGSDAAAVFSELEAACRQATLDELGELVPDDPFEQLERAIGAVFESWNSRRALTYRRFHKIADELGTAVVVQTMVFGNLGEPSGTGVAFTRDPLTGEPELYGEYLEGGQGEDVVAGTSTPVRISQAAARLPEIFAELTHVARELERLYRDVLDIEFTVERGKLYLLQVRSAKRTAEAAIRIAADFLRDRKVAPVEALAKISTEQIRQAERPSFEDAALAAARRAGPLGSGIGASPGQVSGVVVVDPDRAVEVAAAGQGVILARPTTSPLDLHGMIAATGIVTALGGATSHAAVVARALGKPCVVGCAALEIDLEGRSFRIGERSFIEGDPVSIDGASGEIFAGRLPTTRAEASGADLGEVLTVADEAARCRLFGRATTAEQVKSVLDRGAQAVATRLGDVLATTGQLEDLIGLLVAHEVDGARLDGFEEVIADVLTPVLAAAGEADVVVRAVDLSSDEAMELLDGPALLTRHPRFVLPMGLPDFVAIQVAGLALAAKRSGHPRPPQLSVRHVTDPNEAQEIKRIAREELLRRGLGPVLVGPTLTSPRGAQLAPEIARYSDLLWLEVRGLQAKLYGYPASLWLTGDPLDEYVRKRMLSSDPRATLDESMRVLLASVAMARISNPGCRVGVRLAGPVSEELAAGFYRLGFRTFAVDADEVRTARLAFGKAALSE